MKRMSEAEGLRAPSKRRAIENPEADQDAWSNAETASVMSGPDNSSEISTPRPTETTATTDYASSSTNSKPRRKFPSELKTLPCTHAGCPKTFNRPARLAAHLRSHQNDRQFKCPYADCDKDYLEQKHLTQHIKSSHTHEKNYKCQEEGCGMSFVTATRLRRHAKVHEGAERYRCRGYDGCNKSFRKRATLERHVRGDHLGLPRYPCGNDDCTENFDTAPALRRHIARAHGEIAFWCDECEEKDDNGQVIRTVGFTTLALLQSHVRRDHVQCMFCPDIKFTNGQAELDRHMDMYHSGKTLEERKTVNCTWPGCSAKFTRIGNLNVHVRTVHQGLRFVCGEIDTSDHEGLAEWNWQEEGCKDSFTSLEKLLEHARHVHLGQKRPPTLYGAPAEETNLEGLVGGLKYKACCTVPGCDAKFVRNHELNQHVLLDHNLNPYGVNQHGTATLEALGPVEGQAASGLGGLGGLGQLHGHPGMAAEAFVDTRRGPQQFPTCGQQSAFPVDPQLCTAMGVEGFYETDWSHMQQLLDEALAS